MKKISKAVGLCVAALVLAIVEPLSLSGVGIAGKAEAASIKLSKTSLKLSIKESATLKVKGAKKTVKWSSSNKSIATVKNGKVTAKKAGAAKITAKVGNQKLICKVEVTSTLTQKQAQTALWKYIKAKEKTDGTFYGYYSQKQGANYIFFVTYQGVGTKFAFLVNSKTGKVYESGPYVGVNEWKSSDKRRYKCNIFNWL